MGEDDENHFCEVGASLLTADGGAADLDELEPDPLYAPPPDAPHPDALGGTEPVPSAEFATIEEGVPGDARRTQPVAVRVSDHPLAECNALYKIVPDVADEGWLAFRQPTSAATRIAHHAEETMGGVQYAYSVPFPLGS